MKVVFAGILPGSAFGYNAHGIIQTANAVYPTLVLTNRPGKFLMSQSNITVSVGF